MKLIGEGEDDTLRLSKLLQDYPLHYRNPCIMDYSISPIIRKEKHYVIHSLDKGWMHDL